MRVSGDPLPGTGVRSSSGCRHISMTTPPSALDLSAFREARWLLRSVDATPSKNSAASAASSARGLWPAAPPSSGQLLSIRAVEHAGSRGAGSHWGGSGKKLTLETGGRRVCERSDTISGCSEFTVTLHSLPPHPHTPPTAHLLYVVCCMCALAIYLSAIYLCISVPTEIYCFFLLTNAPQCSYS